MSDCFLYEKKTKMLIKYSFLSLTISYLRWSIVLQHTSNIITTVPDYFFEFSNKICKFCQQNERKHIVSTSARAYRTFVQNKSDSSELKLLRTLLYEFFWEIPQTILYLCCKFGLIWVYNRIYLIFLKRGEGVGERTI